MKLQKTWLTLLHAKVPPKKIVSALKKCGDINAVLAAPKAVLKHSGLTENQIEKISSPNIQLIQKELAWLSEHPECHCIAFLDKAYPAQLLEIADPPILLFVKGDVALLNQQQLAIVGARKATPLGRDIAFHFARDLTKSGLLITSGMAAGIDAASHRGALTVGKTIAVVGTGLANCYPRQHLKLSAQIQTSGALVSELPPFAPAKPIHFPRRNRIISGLSLGVLVIEAAEKSGSLITAMCALEQGRDVFAVPGSMQSVMSRGCHQLIRQGAKLVDKIQDVTEDLGVSDQILTKNSSNNLHKNKAQYLDKPHQNLLDCFGSAAVSVEKLINMTGLTSEVISSMLLLLEIEGYITCVPGGYQRKAKALNLC